MIWKWPITHFLRSFCPRWRTIKTGTNIMQWKQNNKSEKFPRAEAIPLTARGPNGTWCWQARVLKRGFSSIQGIAAAAAPGGWGSKSSRYKSRRWTRLPGPLQTLSSCYWSLTGKMDSGRRGDVLMSRMGQPIPFPVPLPQALTHTKSF